MALQAWNADLWTIDHPLVMGGLHIGTRTTVARLEDGTLALSSPGPLDEADAAAIERLGRVSALVAPNLRHHMFLTNARRRFPGSRLYGPLGLAAKRPDLSVDATLSEWSHRATMVAFFVGGMPKLEEWVLLHRASRTLILTDLAFNLRPPKPWFTRTFMRINGGFDRFGPTRIARSLMRDRDAVRASIMRLCAEDFERIVVAHGDVLPSAGPAALRAAFDWLLA
jgi:hypothetical protein